MSAGVPVAAASIRPAPELLAQASPPPPNSGSALASEKPRTHGDSACFAALGASNAARRLAARVPFLVDRAPGPDLLANTGHPDKAEQRELGSVAAGYEMCVDMAADWRRASYAPEVRAELDAYWAHSKAILARLQTGRLSYGDAARELAENDRSYKARVDVMVAGLQPPTAQ